MLTQEYLLEFKRLTEQRWKDLVMEPGVYGLQLRPGTRWNDGISETEISTYESAVGTKFPHALRAFLRVMNGTDLPAINVYGRSGEPNRTSAGVYSFPRDAHMIEQRIEDVRRCRNEIEVDLREQGYDLSPKARLVPFYSHRYVVCTKDLDQSTVLSIYVPSVDAVVYGKSLREYLEREFLGI